MSEFDCPCCNAYKKDVGNCGDCPIYEATGRAECMGISYHNALAAWSWLHYCDANGLDGWIDAWVDYRKREAILIRELERILDGEWERGE